MLSVIRSTESAKHRASDYLSSRPRRWQSDDQAFYEPTNCLCVPARLPHDCQERPKSWPLRPIMLLHHPHTRFFSIHTNHSHTTTTPSSSPPRPHDNKLNFSLHGLVLAPHHLFWAGDASFYQSGPTPKYSVPTPQLNKIKKRLRREKMGRGGWLLRW